MKVRSICFFLGLFVLSSPSFGDNVFEKYPGLLFQIERNLTPGMDGAHLERLLTSTEALRPGSIFNAASVPATIADTDSDGIIDEFERRLGTDPRKTDTDGDGSADLWEIEHGFDPVSRDSKP